MTTRGKDSWVLRIVHQDTGNPAHGVPVTILDAAGNPDGYWVSEADGTVMIPPRATPKLRLRVGLRNEEPIELDTATLRDGPTDLVAPSQLPPPPASPGKRADRQQQASSPAHSPEQPDVPGHVIYFQRLAMFAERPAEATPAPRDSVADFFSIPKDQPASLRYGVLIEVEEYWQSLGVQWGELLYSVSLTPGDEARVVVLDGRWRHEAEARERPLQILARMVGTSMLGDLVTALRPELQLEPLTLLEPGLAAAVSDTVQMIRDRTERMSHALRRRPLGVVDAPREGSANGAIRTVRNTTRDRVVTFHFVEPVERFRVAVRTPRPRAVVFVPFRLPNVATPEVVRRFGYIFRRTLLDRSLLPDLERLLSSYDAGVPGSQLLEHIGANLLYYSTAIISAGDPGTRHVALSKLLDPVGRPLTDVIENTVVGRIGSFIAFPLCPMAKVPQELADALAAYADRPPRLTEGFTVTIPHPGVWVTAQPHEPMQQIEAQSSAG